MFILLLQVFIYLVSYVVYYLEDMMHTSYAYHHLSIVVAYRIVFVSLIDVMLIAGKKSARGLIKTEPPDLLA